MIGNDHTSRVRKGDVLFFKWLISRTRVSAILFYPSPFPSPPRGEGGGEGDLKLEDVARSF